MVISRTSTHGEPHLLAPSANGLNFKSSPTAMMSFNRLKKLPDTVMLFTGVVFLPFSMRKPLAASEKSPVIGLAPACIPSTLVMYTPFPACSIIFSKLPFPGLMKKLYGRMPTVDA